MFPVPQPSRQPTSPHGHRGVAPPGWPRQVRPPDAPDWETTAAAWLLDLCPAEYRRFAGLRRHVVVLARFAVLHVEAQQAAYMETCLEDDEIGERMDAGRHALYQRGDNEVGPYQSPMEDGMQHFHEWYRRAMGADLPPG